MQTRRDIICSGLGLAGIIAAGKAPAAVVKSMLSTRKEIASGGGDEPLSAKSYVQDGLIAMWDGIENAGWGVHDANATVWTELVGGATAGLASGYTFGDDYLQSVAKIPMRLQWGGQSAAQARYSYNYTFEVCLKNFVKNSSGQSAFFGGICSAFRTGYAGPTQGVRAVTSNGSRYETSVTALHNTFTLRSASQSDFGVYIDGKVVVGNKVGTQATEAGGRPFWLNAENGNDIGVEGQYGNLRVYNRALTADEISANYAVDKARFNLP